MAMRLLEALRAHYICYLLDEVHTQPQYQYKLSFSRIFDPRDANNRDVGA